MGEEGQNSTAQSSYTHGRWESMTLRGPVMGDMEVTRGKAIAAAMPILRRATRRERLLAGTAGRIIARGTRREFEDNAKKDWASKRYFAVEGGCKMQAEIV